jgi:hypothetical protein
VEEGYIEMQRLILSLILLAAASSAHALKSTARNGVMLAGQWTVNVQASDDGEAMLARRMEELAKQQHRAAQRQQRRMQNDPFAWEPQFTAPEHTPQFIAAMAERERNRRRLLGLTKQLRIEQDAGGARVTIATDFETRRYDAGRRTQVSLPQGQLADSSSGWDGDWFVIERNARNGPRITEKFRRLGKTDQLEMLVTIKGDSALSGLKLRRVFDRAQAEANVIRGEDAGPVR